MHHGGTFRTLRDAQARRRLVEGWLAAGVDPRVELRRSYVSGASVAQVAEDWLRSRRQISARTREAYEVYVAAIAERFDQPGEVTPEDVRDWIGELEARLKASTVAPYFRTLRSVLDHADVQPNPARHRSVELPRVERKTVTPPDGPDIAKVVAALPTRYRPAVVLMEQTGVRVSEALTLGENAGEMARILVRAEHSKTRRSRWVPCPPWLLEHLPVQPGLNRQVLHNALKRACRDAGVSPFGPHMLRHRRASLWHQQGIPAVELAARLGHARPSMSLDVYSHVRRLSEVPAHVLDALLR